MLGEQALLGSCLVPIGLDAGAFPSWVLWVTDTPVLPLSHKPSLLQDSAPLQRPLEGPLGHLPLSILSLLPQAPPPALTNPWQGNRLFPDLQRSLFLLTPALTYDNPLGN